MQKLDSVTYQYLLVCRLTVDAEELSERGRRASTGAHRHSPRATPKCSQAAEPRSRRHEPFSAHTKTPSGPGPPVPAPRSVSPPPRASAGPPAVQKSNSISRGGGEAGRGRVSHATPAHRASSSAAKKIVVGCGAGISPPRA